MIFTKWRILALAIAVCSVPTATVLAQQAEPEAQPQPEAQPEPDAQPEPEAQPQTQTGTSGQQLEDIVVEAVFRRLDEADLSSSRPPRRDDDEDRELVEIEERLAEHGEMWADGDIDRAGWRAAQSKLE